MTSRRRREPITLNKALKIVKDRNAVIREFGAGVPPLKLTKAEQELTAKLLNFMLEMDHDVIRHVLHPTHGQFDATAAEASRSFVLSFAAKHKIDGVDYDPAFYR